MQRNHNVIQFLKLNHSASSSLGSLTQFLLSPPRECQDGARKQYVLEKCPDYRAYCWSEHSYHYLPATTLLSTVGSCGASAGRSTHGDWVDNFLLCYGLCDAEWVFFPSDHSYSNTILTFEAAFNGVGLPVASLPPDERQRIQFVQSDPLMMILDGSLETDCMLYRDRGWYRNSGPRPWPSSRSPSSSSSNVS